MPSGRRLSRFTAQLTAARQEPPESRPIRSWPPWTLSSTALCFHISSSHSVLRTQQRYCFRPYDQAQKEIYTGSKSYNLCFLLLPFPVLLHSP